MGGISSEREVSLATGKEVFNYLDQDKYDVIGIEWERNNTWSQFKVNSITEKEHNYQHVNDFFTNVKIDIVFIALHGINGEDGKIQGYFEVIGMPYTGSGVLSSSLGMNKYLSKLLFRENNILTPKCLHYFKRSLPHINGLKTEVNQKIGFPCFVKPNNSGSSVGVTKVKTANDLEQAIAKAFTENNSILIEEAIVGLELSVAVFGDYLKPDRNALPIVEIIPQSEFFDYQNKYTLNLAEEIVPARISQELTERVQKTAELIHDLFLCEGYSRTDMLVKDNDIYVLEINTLPGMANNSLYPKMAREVGLTFCQLLDQLISLAQHQAAPLSL